MLPFLAFPRYFRDSPLTQFYKKTLETWISETPMTVWVLYGALFAAALLAGLLPFVMEYASEFPEVRLYLPGLTLSLFLGVRVLMSASVLYCADTQEVFISLDVDARQSVFCKWLAILQTYWRDYFLLALLRALAVYSLVVNDYLVSCSLGLSFVCANDPETIFLMGVMRPAPLLPLVMLMIVFMIVFARLELGLVNAIGIWIALQRRGRLNSLQALGIRAFHGGAAYVVSRWVGQEQSRWWNEFFSLYYPTNLMHLSQIILPLNILQTAVSFPYNSGMWIGENILHGDIGESAAPLFFMHTLLAAAVVMVTFTLLIWLLVRASVRLAVRRGAAPLTLNA